MTLPRAARPAVIGIALAAMLVAATTLDAPSTRTLDAASTRNHARLAGAWRRVFFDDFSHGLHHSRWGVYSGQPGGDPGGWWAPSHAVVAHGVLNLETYRDPRLGGRWVSAGVSSAPALRQTYGKYEVRMRVDRGRGVAFVALLWPSRDVWPPEIDFAENGGETSSRDHITATLHYGADDSQLQRTVHVNLTRWHTLGVQWLPGLLIYTVDDRPWATVRSREVPRQPMELDLQTQAGTCGDAYAPCPDNRTPAHVNAQINWVAAYAYRGPK